MAVSAADVAFADVDPADYVAVVMPGGRAPGYIRNDADAQRIVRHFMTEHAGRRARSPAAAVTGRRCRRQPGH